MSLKDDLTKFVKSIFADAWSERDGREVPTDTSITLGNDAVKLDATVLYADLADSTELVDSYSAAFAAEVYKSYLHCAAKIIRFHGGSITAYDGDRIMAVYIGSDKSRSAVKSAMKLRWAVDEIIRPLQRNQYPSNTYELSHNVGIDCSPLFIAKTGVRGANDLVWVGRAANHAAKMAALPDGFTYISKDVYSELPNECRVSTPGGENMWTAVRWNTFDDRIIYRSSFRWTL